MGKPNRRQYRRFDSGSCVGCLWTSKPENTLVHRPVGSLRPPLPSLRLSRRSRAWRSTIWQWPGPTSGSRPEARSVALAAIGVLAWRGRGQIDNDEFLLRLIEGSLGSDEQVIKAKLALTSREAEVLLWIARGKSNRDVAEILSLNPRTVNKHLEQIYAKLGVENRTSAAALAMRTLGLR
jgi:DNA-binding CsgD family transcriptional regulator